MDRSPQKFDAAQLAHLTLASLEQTATEAQVRQLNERLCNNPAACRFYLDFIETHAAIRQTADTIIPVEKASQNGTAFLEIVKKDLEDSAIRRAIALAETKQESKTNSPGNPNLRRQYFTANDWRNIALKAAAIILLCISILWLDRWIMRESAFQPRRVVAHLIDQLDARWDITSRLPYDDGRMSQDTYRLTQGYATIQFNSGAEIVFEGPAEWILQTEDLILLNYGRAYASVPQQAIGFAIKTSNAKIIDLGTEFGIEVDRQQNTQLHVIKGKTLLISGTEQDPKEQHEIIQNQARQVNCDGTVNSINLAGQRFARGIASRSRLVWKGQPVNLADIVGGGNGFGTGRPDFGIVIETGKLSSEPLPLNGYGLRNQKAWDGFLPTPQIPAVNGIFVPDGGSGPVIVNSQGDIFKQCPDTTSYWCAPIINTIRGQESKDYNLTIGNVTYGTAEHPALFFHANIGITFDLQAIHATLPAGKSMTRFAALTTTPRHEANSLLDIWVLVDGEVRFSRTEVSQLQQFPVEVPLSKQDRFLTLVVTDGIEKQIGSNSYDWCFFCRPELVVE